MSAAKMSLLVIYVVLAALALTMPGSDAGQIAQWLIVGLVLVHAIEVVVFFGLCKKAGGSLPVQLFSVFLFGVLHVKEIKAGLN